MKTFKYEFLLIFYRDFSKFESRENRKIINLVKIKMELIEWAFTILSFIAFYFFISKKASLPSFRIIGLIISIIISILVAIFTLSIGVLSIGIINICYIFLNGYGILNCYSEIKKNKNEVNLNGKITKM